MKRSQLITISFIALFASIPTKVLAWGCYLRFYSYGRRSDPLETALFFIVVILVACGYYFKHIAEPSSSDRSDRPVKSVIPPWDRHAMEAHCRRVFIAMQKCAVERSVTDVKGDLTPELYRELRRQMAHMKKAGERHVREQLSINSIDVVDFKDYRGDIQDRLVVRIKGEMIYYTLSRGQEPDEGMRIPAGFEEIYYFIRKDRRWLLNGVEIPTPFMSHINI